MAEWIYATDCNPVYPGSIPGAVSNLKKGKGVMDELFDINDDDKEFCRCGDEGIEPHICPYAQDINDDDETLCTCCDRCTVECANDI